MERHLRFPSAEERKKQSRGLIAIALQLNDGASVNAYLSAPDNVDPTSFIVIFYVYDVAIQRRVSISKVTLHDSTSHRH